MTVRDKYGEPIEVGSYVVLADFYPPDIPLRLTGSIGYVEEITRRGKLVIRSRLDAYGVRRSWPYHVYVCRSDRDPRSVGKR